MVNGSEFTSKFIFDQRIIRRRGSTQADEMIRYIDENKSRDINRNPNKWWEVFPDTVSDFGFTFVSSQFIGGFKDRIDTSRNTICH